MKLLALILAAATTLSAQSWNQYVAVRAFFERSTHQLATEAEVKAAVTALNQLRGAWIPCRVRLPSTATDLPVIVWGPGLPVTSGTLIDFYGDNGDVIRREWRVNGYPMEFKLITHWRHMPSAPAGK